MYAIRSYAATVGEDIQELSVDAAAPAAAIVFKTVADPFVGKLSYFKVIRGKLMPDQPLLNMVA